MTLRRYKYGITGLNFKPVGGAMVLLPILLALASGWRCCGAPPERPHYWPVAIKDFVFPQLELALTEDEHARGLMQRQEIPEDGGMIFVFDDDKERSFWMKNTLVELDILYLDQHGRIVSMHTMPPEPPRRPDESEWAYNMRLPTYPSRGLARYAIELKGGQANMIGCQVGDRIDIGTQELQRLHQQFAKP